MIQVTEVKTKKQIKEFIEFPLRLYKGVPSFVPPLYADEKSLFSDRCIYNDQAETVFFLATKDGKTVGRISGILQRSANKKWNQKRVRFTRFDAIDDPEVAHALFDKLESWAKAKGMEEIVGLLGYSDMDREGLLIEGFDEPSTFEEQYNYPYYQALIEGCGFDKEVDWLEHQLRAPKVLDERFRTISEKMMQKYNLHMCAETNTNVFLKKYADQFFEIIDLTYGDLYQTVPFTDAMKKSLIASFRMIIDMRFVRVILDENDRIVCFGLCFPAIGKALQKSGGRLTLPAIFKVLKTVKHPEVIDLGLVGVLPEYAKKGIVTMFIWEMMKMLSDHGVEYLETNLNLEENYSIRNLWKNFDVRQHKRRRSFLKKLTTEEPSES
ncbi:MAG: N-acetyltransferase [Clostridia bacterium]|nr:N-acetyltransferase [Clostridia bacterium]